MFEKARPASFIKRFASPEEFASLAAYVLSPLMLATTGAALRVAGGVIESVSKAAGAKRLGLRGRFA
jgi:NAD(P)-dependent dehydrogenase (short-subunit alcohol dehydrogenase family)